MEIVRQMVHGNMQRTNTPCLRYTLQCTLLGHGVLGAFTTLRRRPSKDL
jgi:hypothetical protein